MIGISPLVEFKLHGSATKPAIVIQIFDELLSKNLSLILIHFANSSLSRDQVERLLKTDISIYSKRHHWIQVLNETPEQFNYSSYIEDLSKVELD